MKAVRVLCQAFVLIGLWGVTLQGQTGGSGNNPVHEPIVRESVYPVKILWLSDTTGSVIRNAERLLLKGNGQADLSSRNLVYLENTPGHTASLILDFGIELQGGIQIVTGIDAPNTPVKVRVRLGESVAETMSDTGENQTATNDHAMRDFELSLPWLGKIETGNSGFRFVRIDLLGEKSKACLKEISAISVKRKLVYAGSFRCNDELINKIWNTGAYTVHLNMQEYLWDGIKRDRLVWVGDLHPEVSTALAVFGNSEVIPKSLDLIRDITPMEEWMNGISSYSMWWILIHRDYYYYTGNRDYLLDQKAYMIGLLSKFCSMVDENGKEKLDGHRFLDWPSSPDKSAVDGGYQGLLLMTLRAGEELCRVLGEKEIVALCGSTANRMSRVQFTDIRSKQAAALLGLSGILDKEEANRILSDGGARGFSTFYGFYMLKAMAEAENVTNALKIIRDYWGGMIQLGATTFWEDFHIDWLKNAAPIDQLPQKGKVDVHGTYGGFCYTGYRHSFCHGWASGPTAWLTETVLGVTILEPGCRKLRIRPQLGDLTWVEGTFPTPVGVVSIRHEKTTDGEVRTTWQAPQGVEIVR